MSIKDLKKLKKSIKISKYSLLHFSKSKPINLNCTTTKEDISKKIRPKLDHCKDYSWYYNHVIIKHRFLVKHQDSNLKLSCLMLMLYLHSKNKKERKRKQETNYLNLLFKAKLLKFYL